MQWFYNFFDQVSAFPMFGQLLLFSIISLAALLIAWPGVNILFLLVNKSINRRDEPLLNTTLLYVKRPSRVILAVVALRIGREMTSIPGKISGYLNHLLRLAAKTIRFVTFGGHITADMPFSGASRSVFCHFILLGKVYIPSG